MPTLRGLLAYLVNRAISRPQNVDSVKVHVFYSREISPIPVNAKCLLRKNDETRSVNA